MGESQFLKFSFLFLSSSFIAPFNSANVGKAARLGFIQNWEWARWRGMLQTEKFCFID